jgi:hypothetical protein
MLAAMLASLPALAADHAVSRQASTPNDPFAAYEAQLGDAASRTLNRVAQPDLPIDTRLPQNRRERQLPEMPKLTQNSLQRVKRLRPLLEPILHEVGVPPELSAVVLVESGGEPAALSAKGARGLWQIMPETARRYGLVVNADQDDRLDVLKSTRAAAEYLRDLYARFHDWQLALAAYNAGEQAVQCAVVRTGAQAFSATGQALPQETRNYVPAVLNAMGWFGEPTPLPLTKYAPSDRVVYATGRQ